MTFYEGLILVFGGATDLSGEIFDVVEILDLQTQTWTFGTALQAPRKSVASVVSSDGVLYITGGADSKVSVELREGMEWLDLEAL